jgi:hypothetical protein
MQSFFWQGTTYPLGHRLSKAKTEAREPGKESSEIGPDVPGIAANVVDSASLRRENLSATYSG